jgi:hypothetical protein
MCFFNRTSAKQGEETETVASEKIDFQTEPLFAAIVAMGVTAFGLLFIKTGWLGRGFAFGTVCCFCNVDHSTSRKEKEQIHSTGEYFLSVIFFWCHFTSTV